MDDITKDIPRGFGGDSINWMEPTASDNCGNVLLVDRSSSPGDFFDTGLKTVTYVFNDTSSNQVTCSFNVCVSEGE